MQTMCVHHASHHVESYFLLQNDFSTCKVKILRKESKTDQLRTTRVTTQKLETTLGLSCMLLLFT